MKKCEQELDEVCEFVRLCKQRDYQKSKYDTVQPGLNRTLERMAEGFNSNQIDSVLKLWRKKTTYPNK
jgi:hypothetical protein